MTKAKPVAEGEPFRNSGFVILSTFVICHSSFPIGVGARLLAVGLVLGGFGAWGVGRAMKSLLFDVGAIHPGVLVATSGVMLIAVLLACWLPATRATRATRVDPMEALRCE